MLGAKSPKCEFRTNRLTRNSQRWGAVTAHLAMVVRRVATLVPGKRPTVAPRPAIEFLMAGLLFNLNMTTLYFRHSWAYESALSRLDDISYTVTDNTKAQEYVNKFTEYWQQYNDKVFIHFGKLGFHFSDFWIAYFIRSRDSIVPFSDPLTIFIDDDFEKTVAIIVHELVHVLLVYPDNEDITRKIFETLNNILPQLSFELKSEIAPALISRAILSKIFGTKKTEKLQARERKFSVLGEAWKIIDNSPGALVENNPILAIERLVK